MVKRGNVEDAIEVGARQHLINKRTRVYQLQVPVASFSPTVKRDQQSQASGVDGLNLGQVEQDGVRDLLFEHGALKHNLLPAHDTPVAFQDCQVVSAFSSYR